MAVAEFMKQLRIWLCLCLLMTSAFAQDHGVGQTIQLYTRISSFVGQPTWLLMIRDVDHNQNIPYVFNITSGNNFWVAMTYGRNYLITASTLQFSPYRYYPGNTKRINNFCQLESNGRIVRGESMHVTVTGDLSPYNQQYDCSVSRFPDNYFTIAPKNQDSDL